MNPQKIVITGGPGTGKTSLVNSLEEDGFYCYHEIIRDLTSQEVAGRKPSEINSNPLAFVDDPYQFNKNLLTGRKKQYVSAAGSNGPFVFFDRGIPDVLAYMHYFNQLYGKEFIKACKDHRYDQVVILPPWKEIYTSDGERFESFEEACAIHDELMRTYEKFDYRPIEVPTGSVQERHSFVTDLLNSFK